MLEALHKTTPELPEFLQRAAKCPRHLQRVFVCPTLQIESRFAGSQAALP